MIPLPKTYEIQYEDIFPDIVASLDALMSNYSYQGAALDDRFPQYSAKLQNMMMDRCVGCIVFATENDDLEPSQNEDAFAFLHHYAGVLNFTMQKYISLIAGMEANKAKLLEDLQIVNTNRNWYNDTPQNQNLNSSSEELSHLSTFTKTEDVQENPISTIATRLKDVNDSIAHYWKQWTDEIIETLHIGN